MQPGGGREKAGRGQRESTADKLWTQEQTSLYASRHVAGGRGGRGWWGRARRQGRDVKEGIRAEKEKEKRRDLDFCVGTFYLERYVIQQVAPGGEGRGSPGR